MRKNLLSSFRSFSNIGRRKRVVIVGSGWAGFRLATDLDAQKFSVDVVSPRNHFLFTPLLPSTAVGTLEFRAIQEPVRTIPRIDYQQASVDSIDFDKKTVQCSDAFVRGHTFTLPYDLLVLAPGSEMATYNTPGLDPDSKTNHVYYLKQLQHARAIRDRLIECFERASSPGASPQEQKQYLSFVVVGGGPTNVEFASELFDFLSNDVKRLYPDLHHLATVHLIEAGRGILGSFHSKLVGYVEKLLVSRSINVITGHSVKRIENDIAFLDDGQSIPFGLLVWSAGIKQVPLVESISTSIAKRHPNGRLAVDGMLRLLSGSRENGVVEGVFAIGDCAADSVRPLPALAQVASQQAVFLANSLNGEASSKPFVYQHLGAMMSVGSYRGVYDASQLGSEGHKVDGPSLTGPLAFILWRAAYWTKQVSVANKILILMHWFKSAVFGRDVSRF